MTLISAALYSIQDKTSPITPVQVTRAGEYAVLGLLNLARRGSGSRVMLEELSQQEVIPHSFLAKIFQTLAKAGLVRSHRGTGGGFSLAKSPDEITVLEVIEAIEGRIAFQRCLQDENSCEHIGGCALCGLFEQAQDRVKEVFKQTTLADLLLKHHSGSHSTARNSKVLVNRSGL